MARLPEPPMNASNESLQRALTDVISFMRETFDEGSQHVGFSQAQIDSFTDSKFLGTIVFNTDTNESNVSYLDGGEVKWRAF
jgi:hypothetical protein